MVHTEAFEKDSVFVCDACGLSYRDAEVAAACRTFLIHDALKQSPENGW